MEFTAFPKVPRLSREMIITEKLDGTNASVWIKDVEKWDTAAQEQKDGWLKLGDTLVYAGSRKRFVTPDDDNFGFAKWVKEHVEELVKLGPGTHFGEWWGQGIQRKYGLDHKRFSLFNVGRWTDVHDTYHMKDVGEELSDGRVVAPECCHVVPVLFQGPFDMGGVWDDSLIRLELFGSIAAPGFMQPEGIMIYHTAARQYFKKTFEDDEKGKGE